MYLRITRSCSRDSARYLDPMLGLWTSVDPVRQFSSPYLYAGNGYNPVNVIDPDGNAVQAVVGALTGVTTGIILAYTTSLLTGNEFSYSLGDAATDAFFGAAGLGLMGKAKNIASNYKTYKAIQTSGKAVRTESKWYRKSEEAAASIKESAVAATAIVVGKKGVDIAANEIAPQQLLPESKENVNSYTIDFGSVGGTTPSDNTSVIKNMEE